MEPFYFYAGLVALFTVQAVVRYAVWYVRWRTCSLRALPGPPRRTFVFGYFWDIFREPFLDPHKRWWKQLQKESDGASIPMMAYSSLFGRWSIVVLDPDLVKQVLTEPASREPVRYPKNYFAFREIIGNGLVTMEGGAWARHRRIIQPSFQTNVLKEALNRTVPEMTGRLVAAWLKAKPGRIIDVSSHMSAVTLDVIGEVAFSHDFGALKVLDQWATSDEEGADVDDVVDFVSDPLIQSLTASFKPTMLGILLAIWKISWLQKYLSRKVNRTRRLLNEAVDAVVREAREKAANISKDDGSNNNKSLIQLLFDAKDTEGTRNRLNDIELRDETKTFIVAGHETTSTWCYWSLYALAKFPDIQQRVYDDIARHAPLSGGSSSSDNVVDLEAAEKMTYLDAFLSEVLRLYSPVGMIVRFTSQEENWKGYKIPADTRLVIPLHLLHRHPDYWTDPLDFSPERWLSNKLEREPRHRFAFLPFSAGGRNCIGQRFAEIEAKLIIANLVKAFTIQLAPSLRNEEITFTNYITTKAKPTVKICVKSR